MKRLSMSNKIAGILTTLSIFPILVAGWVGVLPTGDEELMQRRASLSEQLANSCAAQIAAHELSGVEPQLQSLSQTGVRGVRLRRFDGFVLFASSQHEIFWKPDPNQKGLTDCFTIPIMRNNKRWAECEISFAPTEWWKRDYARYGILLGLGLALNGVSFVVFLFRTLSVLDPNSAVPKRVRNTLDTIVGGVVVLDGSGRIMLVNESFAKAAGRLATKMIGTRLESLPWQRINQSIFPWDLVFKNRERATGYKLFLQDASGNEKCFVSNATPIFDAKEKLAGVLLSFEDITEMESQRVKLMNTLDDLEQSREQIRRQNEALKEIASRDALTGALSRRALFENLDVLWQRAITGKTHLVAIMLDVDHFKRLNDTHGHAAGDMVLRQLVQVITNSIKARHLLGRYGGEEFCVLLPDMEIAQGVQVAEEIRVVIETQLAVPYHVTASIGVSAVELQPSSCQMMLEQADKALYVAKHSGRNAVRQWMPSMDKMENEDKKAKKAAAELPVPVKVSEGPKTESLLLEEFRPDDLPVSYQAVVALHAALSYKHADTALHSQRVAESSIAVARGLMSFRELYLLEIAALLHDIGKIGVPDEVLLKPGKLDENEWRIMETHAEIGVEIIQSAFHCKELTDVLAYHHCRYDGSRQPRTAPHGKDIPVAARIVGIADAYDAMISDRVYRKGRPPAEAFAELRRCAGTQFDPILVERFIERQTAEIVSNRNSSEKVFHRSAVHVGQQLERVLHAFENKDTMELKSRLTALRTLSTKCEMPNLTKLVEALRDELKQSDSPDWDLLLPILQNLVDCCLLVQRSYLHELGTKPILLLESLIESPEAVTDQVKVVGIMPSNLPQSPISV
jgi:diguanylate cyclase (GGDEF)-like protein/PAS domain S-box-containing protein/putative nucleotidyltransferase with HDIG domain